MSIIYTYGVGPLGGVGGIEPQEIDIEIVDVSAEGVSVGVTDVDSVDVSLVSGESLEVELVSVESLDVVVILQESLEMSLECGDE